MISARVLSVLILLESVRIEYPFREGTGASYEEDSNVRDEARVVVDTLLVLVPVGPQNWVKGLLASTPATCNLPAAAWLLHPSQ